MDSLKIYIYIQAYSNCLFLFYVSFDRLCFSKNWFVGKVVFIIFLYYLFNVLGIYSNAPSFISD